jgi:hypothetical protein
MATKRSSTNMIEVDGMRTSEGWVFTVTVTEGGSETQHRVSVRESDYQRLTAGRVTPEVLVQESFKFLMEREPKEAILREFDLPVIGRYFPEFASELRRRLPS